MTLGREHLSDEIAQHRLIIDDENRKFTPGRRHMGFLFASQRAFGRKDERKPSPLAALACDGNRAAMPPDNSADHGQAKTGSLLAFRREERFDAAAPHLLGHAGASILDFKRHAPAKSASPKGESTAL